MDICAQINDLWIENAMKYPKRIRFTYVNLSALIHTTSFISSHPTHNPQRINLKVAITYPSNQPTSQPDPTKPPKRQLPYEDYTTPRREEIQHDPKTGEYFVYED